MEIKPVVLPERSEYKKLLTKQKYVKIYTYMYNIYVCMQHTHIHIHIYI